MLKSRVKHEPFHSLVNTYSKSAVIFATHNDHEAQITEMKKSVVGY